MADQLPPWARQGEDVSSPPLEAKMWVARHFPPPFGSYQPPVVPGLSSAPAGFANVGPGTDWPGPDCAAMDPMQPPPRRAPDLSAVEAEYWRSTLPASTHPQPLRMLAATLPGPAQPVTGFAQSAADPAQLRSGNVFSPLNLTRPSAGPTLVASGFGQPAPGLAQPTTESDRMLHNSSSQALDIQLEAQRSLIPNQPTRAAATDQQLQAAAERMRAYAQWKGPPMTTVRACEKALYEQGWAEVVQGASPMPSPDQMILLFRYAAAIDQSSAPVLPPSQVAQAPLGTFRLEPSATWHGIST